MKLLTYACPEHKEELLKKGATVITPESRFDFDDPIPCLAEDCYNDAVVAMEIDMDASN